jgi:hypothetical protein
VEIVEFGVLVKGNIKREEVRKERGRKDKYVSYITDLRHKN